MTNARILTNKRLLLIELNEINFDLVHKYVDRFPGKFKAFESCFAGVFFATSCEEVYDHLEPWIQWPSIHLGKSFDEHRIFRLGDIVGSGETQIFEELEAIGLRVGAISAMNAENKLTSPAYFLPDPWTKTAPDSSFWSQSISTAVSQAVNDNASSRLTFASVASLFFALLRFARPIHYSKYLSLAWRGRGASWRKALFLDLFLHDLHYRLLKSKKSDFSTLFLNAGAHIQHHYLFNSLAVEQSEKLRNPGWYVSDGVDPFQEMLEVYDTVLGEFLDMPEFDLIIATGLSQKPYDRVKFYYRLRDHKEFLQSLGITHKTVTPRMTRDFLIEFDSEKQAADAEMDLRKIKVAADDEPLFGEIDNRGDSLFVTLTYPKEITTDTEYVVDGVTSPLQPVVVFVAIKNGMHQAKGFVYFSKGVKDYAPADGAHVKELNTSIKKYFGLTA